jgi:aspartyl-tRNA synthetase
MSFVEQDDVFVVVEAFFRDIVKELTPEKKITENSFSRLTHKEAIDKYGSDKPDLRFGMKFEDFTEDFRDS